MERPSRWQFLLSHHTPQESHRCVRVGSLRVCARCLGVYPALLAALATQIVFRAPLESGLDLPAAALLPAPAVFDWGRGRLTQASGRNATRILTGMLLGLSLGRTLYLHLVRPGHAVAMAQFAGLLVAVVAIEVVARWTTRASDR